jgi:hypothetical protein
MYVSVISRNWEPPIMPVRYVDWAYFENVGDPSVNAIIAMFEEFKLKDLMGFKYNWNLETYANFIALSTTVIGKTLSTGPLRGSIVVLIT